MFKKWLTVPLSNETKEIEVVQLWEVRWRSRHGEYHADTRPEMEAFTSEKEAVDFAESLKKAFKLIKHIGAGNVEVRKAR